MGRTLNGRLFERNRGTEYAGVERLLIKSGSVAESEKRLQPFPEEDTFGFEPQIAFAFSIYRLLSRNCI